MPLHGEAAVLWQGLLGTHGRGHLLWMLVASAARLLAAMVMLVNGLLLPLLPLLLMAVPALLLLLATLLVLELLLLSLTLLVLKLLELELLLLLLILVLLVLLLVTLLVLVDANVVCGVVLCVGASGRLLRLQFHVLAVRRGWGSAGARFAARMAALTVAAGVVTAAAAVRCAVKLQSACRVARRRTPSR